MRERPILFSGAMVNAILSGAKTQTRRVVKFDARSKVASRGCYDETGFDVVDASAPVHKLYRSPWESPQQIINYFDCPYGKVGDRLWVRETWQPFCQRMPEQEAKIKAWFDKGDHSNFMNEVDEWSPMPDGEMSAMYAADFGDWAFDVDSDLKPWKPSIFMPRWASRITLEITGVRVERLNEISGTDVVAEGVDLSPIWENNGGVTYEEALKVWTQNVPRDDDESLDQSYDAHFIACFKRLWDKINGKKHPWASNPFVWVIEFKRLEQK